MAKPVAIVLPVLLAVAAIGGLIEDITQDKIPIRYAYLLILLVTVGLTWSTNVNEIIAYASRAFALYYTLRCVVAWVVAWQDRKLRSPLRLATFAFLALMCFLVFTLGIPSG